MQRETLIDFFNDLARADGDFLVYDDGFRCRTFSYREVGGAARAFAGRLRTAGLRKGDKVLFFSENRPEWIVAFWGCLLGGVIVVPVDYRSSTDFLKTVGRIVGARIALVGQDVPVLDVDDLAVWQLHDLEWTDGPSPGVPIERDDIAEIIFTSGATADPKGVVISHRNILANIVPVEREVIKYRKWGRPFFPLCFLNLLPLSHMFGQAMATFVPPMLPGSVMFIRGYNPGVIVSVIKERRVSVLVSVPKILDVLREYVSRHAESEMGEEQQPRVAAARSPSSTFAVLGRTALRWWRHLPVHRMFGFKFWAFVVGAAPLDTELEAFWGDRGFAVIQGYGLTETAPIVSLNHPFGTKRGSVGKPIAGVEIKIAPDGEILVRGENVTTGYFGAADQTAAAFEGGWFHTGDVGETTPNGQLFIRGRKKEMIVTPEGLNVFPEDIESVLNQVPGVRESAVVGVGGTGGAVGRDERVCAVMVLEPGLDTETVVRTANARLADHQKIRRAVTWPGAALPRTEGTRKLKRAVVRDWVGRGGAVPHQYTGADSLDALLRKYSDQRAISPDATIDQLGLSSLERVEFLVALEDAYQTRIDEGAFAQVQRVSDLRQLIERSSASDEPPPEPVDFPSWNRSWPARAIRRICLPTWILPLARMFAWTKIEGLEHLKQLEGPVIFASNHQSHMDTPVIMSALPARWRYRLAPAMAKEFFRAHFFPAEFNRRERLTNGLNYTLAALFFNAFPLPQREAGARQTLRYIGTVLADGFSILIFPEGRRSGGAAIDTFRPGIGMIAARLDVTVVPVRLEGLDRVLAPSWRMAKPGRVRVAFGSPLHLTGEDYQSLAKAVEDAVRAL